MKSIWTLLFLMMLIISFFSTDIRGQEIDLKDFTYLKSSGNVPKDFTSMFSEKYREDKSEIGNDDRRSVKKTKMRFLAESNFIIDQILLSGRVLYNDPVSVYIAKVADNLLKNNQELRSQLRFYISKSPSVNAFSTDKGIIIVNIGLIAQLENEAQLAYVLAHEIVHYAKKHNMNLYLEKDKIFNGKDGFNNLTMNERYLATNYRSRELESEADENGLKEFYEASDYSLASIDGVFDVLLYSYLPFDDIPLEKSFFETEYMSLPDDYFLPEIKEITGEEETEGEQSTHPNIKSRREFIQRSISDISNTGKKEFVLPKEEFMKIRSLSRFECIREYMILSDYANAIYNSYIMLKEYPGNKFLEKAIAYSMYALTKYKIEGNLSDVLKSYKKVEGQSQQLNYLLSKLKKEEFVILALRNVWLASKKNPGDSLLSNICDDLFNILIYDLDKTKNDFYTKSKVEIITEIDNAPIDTTKKTGKYAKIKKQKTVKSTEIEGFIGFAFVDLFKDPTFVDKFEYYLDEKLKKKEKNELEFQKEARREKKMIKKHGYALGIDKVLIKDPFYMVIDERKRSKVSYFDSEDKLQTFYKKIEQNASLSGLEIEIFNPKNFTDQDNEKFIELTEINDWLTERLQHEEIELIPYESGNIRELMEKYHTSYINWSGVVSVREKKKGVFGLVMALFIPYYTPFAAYILIKPKYQTYYFDLLFNMRNGELKMGVANVMKHNDRRDILNSSLYDTFHQIKSIRNKK